MKKYKENLQLRFLLKCDFDVKEVDLILPSINYCGVYAIMHTPDSKFYVGSARDLNSRLRSHLNSGKFTSIDPNIFNFKILILDYGYDLDSDWMTNREAYWCTYYDSFINGYNKSKDGSGFDSNKGRIWVHIGTKNYRIYEHEFDPNIHTRGFLDNNIKGRLNVTKEGIDKRIMVSELAEHLDKDWSYGKTFISSPLPDGYTGYDPTRHKTRMNNGVTEIYVTDSWYHYWVAKGYVAGRLNESYRIVTDGKEEVSIYSHELDEYLGKGYTKGHLVEYHNATANLIYDESLVPERTKRIWLTKLGMDTNIEESRESEYTDDWKRGRALILSRTVDGSYSPDRYTVFINDGKEEFSVVHYYLPYWLNLGYKIGYIDGKKRYISNGIIEMIINPGSDAPEGFEYKSLAEFHMKEIEEYYQNHVK